jgi:hypothetical protein
MLLLATAAVDCCYCYLALAATISAVAATVGADIAVAAMH